MPLKLDQKVFLSTKRKFIKWQFNLNIYLLCTGCRPKFCKNKVVTFSHFNIECTDSLNSLKKNKLWIMTVSGHKVWFVCIIYGFSAIQLSQINLITPSHFYETKQIISQKGFRYQIEQVKGILKNGFKGRYRKPALDRQEDEVVLVPFNMVKAFNYYRKEVDFKEAATEKFLKFSISSIMVESLQSRIIKKKSLTTRVFVC